MGARPLSCAAASACSSVMTESPLTRAVRGFVMLTAPPLGRGARGAPRRAHCALPTADARVAPPDACSRRSPAGICRGRGSSPRPSSSRRTPSFSAPLAPSRRSRSHATSVPSREAQRTARRTAPRARDCDAHVRGAAPHSALRTTIRLDTSVMDPSGTSTFLLGGRAASALAPRIAAGVRRNNAVAARVRPHDSRHSTRIAECSKSECARRIGAKRTARWRRSQIGEKRRIRLDGVRPRSECVHPRGAAPTALTRGGARAP
jgi:hypothetical protein